jgi:hypothetical protein
MSGECVIPNEQLCGCCAGVTSETPERITNRPALSSIAYRAGRYSTFRESMLAALSDPSLPALALLRTRDTSDFSIALLDAWSVTLDILTFYQERLANEAFLRTAINQRSVFELARLVGYVPSPGVSASAVLAITLSSAAGSPVNVVIPAGTRVQSVPGPGQKPQIFETSSDLTAVIACNSIPAQTTLPWQLFGGDTSTWIAGTANNINVGDALLFLSATAGKPNATGPASFHYVSAANIDPISGNTRITWNNPLSADFTAGMTSQDVLIYVFRKKAALYGVQAPSPLTLSGDNVTYIPGYPTIGAGADWNFSYAEYSDQINLDASYSGLAPQANGPIQWIVLTGLGYTSFFQIKQAMDSNPGRYTLTAKTTQLTLAFGRILSGDTALTLNEVLWEFVQETRNITAYVQSAALTPSDLPNTVWPFAATYPLADGMVAPVQGSSISVVGGQQIAAGQPIGISGKRVRLKITAGSSAIFVPANSSASLAVTSDQEFLVDSFPPVADPPSGSVIWEVLTTSSIAGWLVVDGSIQLSPADKDDPVVGESAVVSVASVSGNITTLGLMSALARIYDANTTRVNANAVESTNGETVQEILGSGDATNDALQFTLKQAPLTYISSSGGNGSQSTLQVWVNNLRWSEVSNLLAAGPADRVFVTRVNPDGKVIVQFGNGTQGERTPTGQSNIRTVYRKGIGSPGMVNAAQLSQPLDRPQGLKAVTNPGAASGAADPATADDARASAPLPTLTIGRVVSIQDYQNFALAFAGIAKAIATWTWFGNRRGVFLTVAGENGTTLSNSDPIVSNLIAAIQSRGNPFVPLQVASYVPILFDFSAGVNVDPAFDSTLVLAQVWQNISNAFAFDNRQPAQNVVASEIIQIIQQTPGVIAVQLQSLQLSGESGTGIVPAMLCASAPQPPQGAQMLLLDPQAQSNIGVWS